MRVAILPIGPGFQDGMVVALVLWVVAGLSLLVAGLMHQSRLDVQLTRLQLEQARSEAAARGAAHLLMRDLVLARNQGDYQGRTIFGGQYILSGLPVSATATPVAGLVNLNQAPLELLLELFHQVGGMTRADAGQLAETLVKWRQPGSPDDGFYGPLLVVEDLLKVPGMSRAVYDRVGNEIHALPGLDGAVDPLAAPHGVLLALAGGDRQAVSDILAARGDKPGGLAISAAIAGGPLTAVPGQRYRLDLDVRLHPDHLIRQRVWAAITVIGDSVPWQFTRVHPLVFVGAEQGAGKP